MAGNSAKIPVIDLFAGPGGLGEGFSAYRGNVGYQIKLSIEKDPSAHKTLLLRSFFRQFESGCVPEEYYNYVSGRKDVTRETLAKLYPLQWKNACHETWLAELGSKKFPEAEVDKRISAALNGTREWILIGGPPCQAYSLAGRSRMKGADPEAFEKDHRHFLYKQYLRILKEFEPSVFIMENVKGLLSSKINDQLIFHRILRDLKDNGKYSIYSLSLDTESPEELMPDDFIIKAENYGIPQSRHRLILLGVRNNTGLSKPDILRAEDGPSVKDMLSDLPRLRSRISRRSNKDRSQEEKIWLETVRQGAHIILKSDTPKEVKAVCKQVIRQTYTRGWRSTLNQNPLGQWIRDEKLKAVLNHDVRSHMVSDIQRYLFSACYAAVFDQSPRLRDFPAKLLPKHKNIQGKEKDLSTFADRFKVQVASKVSSTVVAHIAKDGHYYIHPDPLQCRSLTVREAARLQTFPDNYFFEGNRTQQYTQVGNAVPPYLALQIARAVAKMIAKKSALNEQTSKKKVST